MARTTYRRTERGRQAWETENRAVPLEYRRILGHIRADVDCDTLRARVGYSEAELSEVMAALEALGLVESLGDERSDLDFTGNFNVADIRKAQAAAQDDLDFTGTFSIADLRAAAKKP